MPVFCRLKVPDKPLRIQLRLDLIDRMECEVLRTFRAVTVRGSEIGGVLLGRIEDGDGIRTITIDECELVPCDYSRGPLYRLSDDDRRRMRQTVKHYATANEGLSVVGFFRSNTRRELAVDDEDREVFREFCTNPDCVFLLVKPFASKPSIAAFVLWNDGEVHGRSELQFPFRRSELRKIATRGATRAAEHRAPQTTAVPNSSGEPSVGPPEPAPKQEHIANGAPFPVCSPAPAAAPKVAAARSVRILGPVPPALLIDSNMRAEWERAAATRAGRVKEYLLRLMQYFCEHSTLLWIENVPASDRRAAKLGSVWKCAECHRTIHRKARQPYACEEPEPERASYTPPRAGPSGSAR
jgi:hypothetical protein